MSLKRYALIGSLTAGLLLAATPLAAPALADTTVSVSSYGTGATAKGVFTANGLAMAGAPAFLTVTDSSGTIYHLDQTTTDKDGSYQFDWTMPTQAQTGSYTVKVAIQGDVKTQTFTYTAPAGSDTITPIDVSPYRFTGELNSGSKQVVIYDANSGLNATSSGGVSTATLVDSTARSAIQNASSDTNYLTVSVPAHDASAVVTVQGSVIAQMLTKFGPDAHLLVAAEAGSYDLPLAALNSAMKDAIQKNANGALRITIKKADATTANSVDWQLIDLKAQKLVQPVQFTVEALYSGQTIPVRDFGDQFVTYSLDLTGATLNTGTVQSALFLHPASQKLAPTPSRLYRDAMGHGKIIVTRTGNGVYVPVQAKRTFDDIQFHYLANQIEQLASRYVINGESPTQYAPSDKITRAEFATLMVRALGLSDKQGSSLFTDVPAGEWYADTVAIGSTLGLISGNTPYQFSPNDPITREQMAALLARSLQYVQTRPYVDTIRILGQANDRTLISGWAREDVALAMSTGIMSPNFAGNIEPDRTATRAESADMLYNLLKYLKMI